MVIFAIMLLQSASILGRKSTGLTEYPNESAWTMFQSFKDDTCVASSTFAKDTDFSIHWRPRKESVKIFINDPALQSIKDEAEYQIEVDFVKNAKLDKGWGTVTATGSLDNSGKPGFAVSLHGKVALNDLRTSQKPAFFYKGKLVESLDLSSTVKVVPALLKCGNEILANHPLDPFEE